MIPEKKKHDPTQRVIQCGHPAFNCSLELSLPRIQLLFSSFLGGYSFRSSQGMNMMIE